MRERFFKLLILLCAMTFCTTVSFADTISVVTVLSDDNDDKQPHRTPVNQGVYDTSQALLYDTGIHNQNYNFNSDIAYLSVYH